MEYEQGGRGKADYGKKLIDRLAIDLTKKFGRGFGRSNLFQMRSFYLAYAAIVQTPSGISTSVNHNQIRQTLSGESKYKFTGEPYLQALSENCKQCLQNHILLHFSLREYG